MRTTCLFGSLVLLFAIGLPLASASIPAPPGERSAAQSWLIQCVDCPRNFETLTDQALQLDAGGHPHLAYGGDRLYYAWHDGVSWHYQTVDARPSTGEFASLALDASDYPHIAYYAAYGNLFYATWNGISGTWHIETVDGPFPKGQTTSLALDGSGRPHVAYKALDTVRYAYRDPAGTGHIETVETGVLNAGEVVLAVDAAGSAHVLYRDDHLARYAYRDGAGVWHAETLGEAQIMVGSLALALDAAGRPHAGLDLDRALVYAYRDDSLVWHMEVAVDPNEVRAVSLALAPDGTPHIAYSLDDAHRLAHMYRDAYGWHSAYVLEEDAANYLSLDVDAAGRPYIAYYSGLLFGPGEPPDHRLRVATLDGGTWQAEIVDENRALKTDVALAVAPDGTPHAGYANAYATLAAAGWLTETVGFGITDMVVDGEGVPHALYTSAEGLGYAIREVTGWVTEPVLSGPSFKDTSLALDAAGQPHVSYTDWVVSGVQYGYRDGAGWHWETVDDVPFSGETTSLALDPDGNPHVAYPVYFEGLRHAYRDDGGVWHVEVVDDQADYISLARLAIDSAGGLHVGYYTGSAHDMEGDLKYAYRAPGAQTWQLQVVDGENDAGAASSLALGPDGRPRISYATCPRDQNGNCTRTRLRYATQNSDLTWRLSTIEDLPTEWCRDTSLAVDGDGRPHIVYSDVYNDDVRYATWPAPGRTIYLPLVMR